VIGKNWRRGVFNHRGCSVLRDGKKKIPEKKIRRGKRGELILIASQRGPKNFPLRESTQREMGEVTGGNHLNACPGGK